MEPLKNMFNGLFYKSIADEFSKLNFGFDSKSFLTDCSFKLEHLSLSQRLRQTTLALKKYLPENYPKAINLMNIVITKTKPGYTNLIFPDYVGLFGHHDFKTSMQALHYFTQFGSSEFAIREFLKRDFNKTILVMQKWATDKNHHVRRLSSEGSRPRLPWAFKLDEVIVNPNKTKLILETLKTDSSLYVKKSVANHLNDISKQHPNYIIDLLKSWDRSNINTYWIAKHACRNLIKKGDLKALSIFNFESEVKIKLINFKLSSKIIELGDSLRFEFDVLSLKDNHQKLVLDYGIYYPSIKTIKKYKIFKLKEFILKSNQEIHISKKQIFKDLSTRKYKEGLYNLVLFVNGKEYFKSDFKIKNSYQLKK